MSDLTMDVMLSEQHPDHGKHSDYVQQKRNMGFVDIADEMEASNLWCGWGNMSGVMTRLENTAGASIPDIIFMSGGLMMWMEVKYQRGDFIYSPAYQLAYMVRVSNQLNDWQHHYVVYSTDRFKIYTGRQIKSAPSEVRGNKVRHDVSKLKPVFEVVNHADFEKYRDYLEKVHFGE